MTIDEKRLVVAQLLNLNPADPASWPVDMLDDLTRIREQWGEREFLHQITLTPP